jgi:NTE family protein
MIIMNCGRAILWCLILIVALGSAVVPDAVSAEEETKNRPKIGLVLGGGGAKGAAHIGVLQVLEELRIPVDYIAGTSMGAIVGALYASGLSPEKIEAVLTAVDWDDIFSGDPDRQDIDFRRKKEDYQILSRLTLGLKDGKIQIPKGLVKDQKVNVLFETLMLHAAEINDFDRLSIPYRAVAADLETGEMVVLKNGRLADAARASMSVPGAFPPVEVNGRLLIDGGIVRNVPVDIAREMGADIIIAIDVGKPLRTREEIGGALSVLGQMLDIMLKKNVEEQIASLGPDDVYINPELGDLDSGDFTRAVEGARMGEKAARDHIKSLKRYAVPESEYEAFLGRQRRDRVTEVKIASLQVEVEGESGISPDVVKSRLTMEQGETVDLEELEKNAGYVYGTGDFERVDLLMKRQGDGYDLVMKAKEKTWGPNYLRFGMALESDFEGWSRYNLLVDYTRRWVNHLGAEWKTRVDIGSPSGIYSEFYQPLRKDRLFFISPYAQWEQRPVDVFEDNDRVAQYRVSGYELGIDLGIQPEMYGEARVGLLYGSYKASTRIGHFALPDDRVERGGIVIRGGIDQLDNVNFPNKGYFARIEALAALESLGTDINYNKVEGAVLGVFTFKKQTVLLSVEAASHIGRDLPFYDQVELGGFLSLSGFRQNQLRGQSMAIGKLVTYHKIGESFFGDLYLGGSLESGNVWQEDFEFDDLVYAGSIFLGYDTILGPLYLGLGLNDDDRAAGYLYLGRTF